MPLGWGTTFWGLRVLSKMASCFQILELEVLDTILKKIVERIKYQKDAQRNSVQKEVLNSSPSFFSTSLVKKTLIAITSQDRNFARWGARKAKLALMGLWGPILRVAQLGQPRYGSIGSAGSH